MKKIKLLSMALFVLMILLPLLTFQTEAEVVSDIDNRKLADNPWVHWQQGERKDIRKRIQNYINDRIGFRSDMIMAYTRLNDICFGEMVHPSYRYGKNGYVFSRGMLSTEYNSYHEVFADMVKSLADYCESRGVAFIFVWEPYKQEIYPEYISDGIHYDSKWVVEMMKALEKRNIRYVDNTITMETEKNRGEEVFNKKFDSNHWNAKGLFYGSNAILSELQKQFPGVKPNNYDAFTWNEKLMTTLPVSKYPIEEWVPDVTIPMDGIENIGDIYRNELV